MGHWLKQGALILVGVAIAAMAAVGAMHATFDLPTFTAGQLEADITVGTPAPDFELTNAWTGRAMALHQLYGAKPILLFFIGPGPGQSTVPARFVRAAQASYGRNVSRVTWAAVNADALPVARGVVTRWLRREGLAHKLTFFTGGILALDTVWTNFAVNVSVIGRRPAYTWAVYVLSPEGAEESALTLSVTAGPRLEARELAALHQATRPWLRDRGRS